ncbi:MAG: mechanosensitive ion channel [Bacteroidales bacterium]
MNKIGIVEIEILLTLIVIILMTLFRVYIKRLIVKYVDNHGYSLSRKAYAMKFFNFLLVILTAVLVSLIWELSFKGLSIYFVSFFTFLGVAFFANWSILSNITASIVLFFNYPFKIGDIIRIYDDEDSKYGKVIDIGLFNIKLLTDENELIVYPNNIAIQKPIIKKDFKNDIY